MVRSIVALAAVALVAAGCDSDGVGPEADGEVVVAFRTGSGASAAPAATPAAAPLTIGGDNGTLVLDRVLMVVGKFKLEGSDDACVELADDDEDDLEDCESFEAAPFLLDLSLDGGAVTVAREDVTVGSYSELEFEVEDVDMDDDDDDEEELATLAALIRAQVPDWPDDASMMVVGTFTPTGGAPRDFRVFVDAEVEVEMVFDQPLVVGEDSRAEVTVVLDPARWFMEADGDVLDLSALDFGGGDDDLLELEVKLKEGFVAVEVELDD